MIGFMQSGKHILMTMIELKPVQTYLIKLPHPISGKKLCLELTYVIHPLAVFKINEPPPNKNFIPTFKKLSFNPNCINPLLPIIFSYLSESACIFFFLVFLDQERSSPIHLSSSAVSFCPIMPHIALAETASYHFMGLVNLI